jgi:hypothetical protein
LGIIIICRRNDIMNIDFDRICKLAGVSGSGNRKVLKEASYEEGMMQYEEEEAGKEEGMMQYEEEEEAGKEEGMMQHEEERHDEMDNEVVEVDVGELMSEIRRAKKIMNENKIRAQRVKSKKRKIEENKLKRAIAREVENVLSEMEEHDSSWLYGNKKPRHSKKGHSNQGRLIPGIGFRNF